MIIRNLAEHSRFREDICVFGHPVAEQVPTIEFRAVHGRGRSWLSNTAKKIEDFQADIIEVHQHLPTAAYMAQKFKHIPVLAFKHNPILAPKNLLKKWLGLKRLRALAHIVFVSEYCRLEFARDWPEFLAKASVIHNAVQTEHWLAPVGRREQLISFVGRAVPDKGLEPLIDAFYTVLSKNSDWSAILITTRGDKYPKLEKKLAKLAQDFPNQITWLRDQPLENVQNVMKRSAIAVVPSIWQEPFGLTALEAHLSGAAVISSGKGGLSEVSGPHALYLDEVTSTSIAKTLECLIEDEELRLELQSQGQKYVLDAFDLKHQAEKMDDLRDQLMNSKIQKTSLEINTDVQPSAF